MPEIAEVYRIVHFLRKYLVGRIIASVEVQEDANVYGKVGTSASEFKQAITGKKVLEAHAQGKYFWLVMSSPPHPLMHFGMTGWMKFSNDDSTYYRPAWEKKEEWPPRFWKFILETQEKIPCKAAFVDSRRFGRIRLLDCDASSIRKIPPLSLNGPDPIADKAILTKEWFKEKVRARSVPIKAWLLDQASISGIGNWVGDEIMYHSRTHPEQYSNTLSDNQLSRIYDSLMYICETAVAANAESSKFPDDWLMLHRWGKGQKDNKLPNGARITFLEVGGRTSAIVPSVQKKSGPVAGDLVQDATKDHEITEQVNGTTKRNGKYQKAIKPSASGRKGSKVSAAKNEGDGPAQEKPKQKRRKGKASEEEEEDVNLAETEKTPAKKQKTSDKGKSPTGVRSAKSTGPTALPVKSGEATIEAATGLRRSKRLSGV